jgi:hypothetical protein
VCHLKDSITEARGQFGKSEEEERSPLETVTRRLLKTMTEDTRVCV